MRKKSGPTFVTEVLKRLKLHYPDAHCTLAFGNPFELLVATILSAQCTDIRVNKITPELFLRFPDPLSFSKATIYDIEDLIRSGGFYHQKAKSIMETSKNICSNFNGNVPENLKELTGLPGIGRKTANVLLSTAFNKNEGVVVDTHVKRISNRLGFSSQKQPEKIEKDLMEILPKDSWGIYSHLLIEHGRKICEARKPDCLNCFLNDICPSSTA